MDINLVFTLFLSFWGLVALCGFSLWLINRWLWEQAKRDRYSNRYSFDDLGNPQFYFNPKTGIDYLPLPGNKAFPEQTIYQVSSTEGRRPTRRPTIYVEGKELSEPLHNDLPELPANESTSPQLPASTSEVVEKMQDAIEQGMTKTQAIKEVFGITGGSRFSKLASLYDRLSGKE